MMTEILATAAIIVFLLLNKERDENLARFEMSRYRP